MRKFIHQIRSTAELAPLGGIALLASVLCLAVTAGWWQQQNAAHAAVPRASAIVSSAALPTRLIRAEPDLPAFDPQILHRVLMEGSTSAGVSLPEVMFTLHDSDAIPYIRYRSAMTVTAPYPAIRRFVSIVLSTRANAMLESISCVRQATEQLKCEVAITEVYRGNHG